MSSETDAIAAADRPATVATLRPDLEALGLASGDVAIVHSSLSALGWVAGGPQAVVEALLAVIGTQGTLVMPTQSGQLTDPADWANPPVPAEWVERVRDGLPAYDPFLTPTRGMGAVVDCFRQHPHTQRGSHPTLSFAANGPQAEAIVDPHPLAAGLGDGSPLGRLFELDAKVVLLGVGHVNNTSLHLAEHRADWRGKATTSDGAPMLVDGIRQWVTYTDLDRDEDDFEAIGEAFAAAGGERSSPVGIGLGRLSDMRAIVEFAVGWMDANRGS